jgi:hypothetical protein
MKRLNTIIKKSMAALVWLPIVIAVLVSCDGMNDMHKKFLEDGELVYLPKPDSMLFLPDRYSALIRLWFYNSPNAKTIDVYWNNDSDSLLVPVSLHTGIDSIDIEIPNLEEKSYEFTVYATDAVGNRSIPVIGSISVIGEFWEASLSDRQAVRIEYSPEQTLINWDAFSNCTYTELEYQTTNGATKLLKILPAETVTRLTDARQGFAFLRYRSVYAIAGRNIEREWLNYSPHYTLFSVGESTPYGWTPEISQGLAATVDDPNVWDFQMYLNGGNVRFLTEQNWSCIQLYPDLQVVAPGSGYFQLNPNVTKNWSVTQAGNYHIRIDLNDLSISFTIM